MISPELRRRENHHLPPATTTHGRIPAAEREAAGIVEGLVRLAVGLEDPGDIRADLERGLGAG
jgi:O-succinylhomoserine sulfhydrylase